MLLEKSCHQSANFIEEYFECKSHLQDLLHWKNNEYRWFTQEKTKNCLGK